MSFSGWMIAISIVVIILAITFGIAWSIRNSSLPSTPPNKYDAPLVWGAPFPSTNPVKNVCQVYTFPTTSIQQDQGLPPGTVIPGTPTLDSNILDGLTGFTGLFSCIDADQLAARQVTHTCQAPNGVFDGQITLCRLINGGFTGLNAEETFYTPCPGNGLQGCPGQVAAISVNFQAPANPNIFCIQGNGPNASVSMEPCDPSIPTQLFRVTRINQGQNPSSLSPGGGQNGPIAQILDRASGLCLAPGNITTTTTYDQSYLNPIGCTGNFRTEVTGTNLVLTQCTGGQYPGYNWYLLPSYPYCSVPGGCPGCTGCVSGCDRVPGTNICQGTGTCQNCSGFATMVTPPQIVYIGDIDINTAPTGGQEYFGLTGTSALIQWFRDQGAQSLYFGGTGNNIVLTDLGIDYSVCQQKPYVSQYINLTTYNIISQEQVCIQQGTFGTLSCPFF
jgi:hypothetical protein